MTILSKLNPTYRTSVSPYLLQPTRSRGRCSGNGLREAYQRVEYFDPEGPLAQSLK